MGCMRGLGLALLHIIFFTAPCNIADLQFGKLGWARLLPTSAKERQGVRGWSASGHSRLSSSQVRERDTGVLRGIVAGGAWNGIPLGQARGEVIPCRFCGCVDGGGHLFRNCSDTPLVRLRESPEVTELMNTDTSLWPRCLLWHGCLPSLSGNQAVSLGPPLHRMMP